MDKATRIHTLISGALAGLSILALYLSWGGKVGGVVVLLVNIYLLVMLYEAVHRSAAERRISNGELLSKPIHVFAFPAKMWMGLLVFFIVCATVTSFANMYISSGGIAYVGPVMEVSSTLLERQITIPPASIMESRIDALYFSLVTMITLGYGDFLPVSSAARLLVMWQLATGGLMVIGIFPLIITRAADF